MDVIRLMKHVMVMDAQAQVSAMSVDIAHHVEEVKHVVDVIHKRMNVRVVSALKMLVIHQENVWIV